MKTISVLVTGCILMTAVGGEAVSVVSDDTDLPSKTGIKHILKYVTRHFPNFTELEQYIRTWRLNHEIRLVN